MLWNLTFFFVNSPAAVDEIPELKKPKLDKSTEELENLIAAQNIEFYANRDFAQSKLAKSNWIQILEVNKQIIPKTDDDVCFKDFLTATAIPKTKNFFFIQKLDLVAEILTFGSLEPCPDCAGQFVFSKNGYVCTGRISDWAKCENFTKEPARKQCQIPSWLINHFAGRKVVVQNRALNCVEASSTAYTKTYDPDAVWL